MVRQSRDHLDGIFAALADPTRRAILAQLTTGDATISDLAAPHDMSFAAVSRHVQVLAAAGLMQRTREGKTTRCRLDPKPLDTATAWLTHHRALWQHKLAALGDFLEQKK